MINLLKKIIRRVFKAHRDETALLAIGAMLSNQQYTINSTHINDYEFKIFSEYGDDGIIQYLIKNLDIKNNTFIEFGVESYLESNTRFLMMNNNWAGFVLDGSDQAMSLLRNQSWYWRYSLDSRAAFVDKDNINQLLAESGMSNVGLLHVDIDGNDYHILSELDFSKLNPSILIMEYNSVFGKDRPISTPYRKDFYRNRAHYSNLFFGSSLSALNYVASGKGYSLIGCNLAGNNAYFVRKDLLNDKIKKVSVDDAFRESKFRQSRNKDGSLSFLSGEGRYELIKGLDVLNVITNKIEKL